MAAALARGDRGADAVRANQQRWSSGDVVEVGGTVVPAGLASACEERELAPPRRMVKGHLVWLDVQTRTLQTPSKTQQAWLDRWTASGWVARWQAIEGPAFWMGPDVSEMTALALATIDAVRDESMT